MIYIVCDNIVLVVLMMFDLTLSSILQNPFKTPAERTHYMKSRLERERDSVYYNTFAMITNSRQFIYLYHFIKIISFTRRVCFSSKMSMITNVILIFYNSLINKKLIKRLVF